MTDELTGIPHLVPSETFSNIHWWDFIDSKLSSVHLENKVSNEEIGAPTEPNPKAEANTEQSSHQRVEELDGIITYVRDNISSDQLATKIPETMEQEQPIPHVKTIPIEKEN